VHVVSAGWGEAVLTLLDGPRAHRYVLCAAAGAVAALTAKRDMLARRVEGLLRCKSEFAELAKCL
jgi:hypothetical protein